MLQEREAALYKKVKDLYEQSKTIWKGVVFEILLDPINPQPGEIAERHFIDYSDCIEDFQFNVEEGDREYTLDELFSEIDKLHDYQSILKAANECIENIREQYKDDFEVTLLRVLDYNNKENNLNLNVNIFESDTESDDEGEEEEEDEQAEGEDAEEEEFIDDDDEEEEQWAIVWESDSGMESPVEYDEDQDDDDLDMESSDESRISNDSDSGAELSQSESDNFPNWLLNWESDSEPEMDDE